MKASKRRKMNVYKNIKAIAEEQGMTIKDVAYKAGIGESSIYRWKVTQPSITSLRKVANVLNVSVNDLMQEAPTDTQYLVEIQRMAKRLRPNDQKKLLKIIEILLQE